MPPAARVGDTTTHMVVPPSPPGMPPLPPVPKEPGVVGPPGVPTVLICGLPAANATTPYIGNVCPGASYVAPCPTAFLPATAIPTVLIGGAPALVTGSTAPSSCAAAINSGAPTVRIGG
ncbi:MAG: PaaR repeat-containing protein [Pseudonocardiaceae bacterium]|nr:PaaR repeat-containing protein [Pseudonocardiaceae bacterium]